MATKIYEAFAAKDSRVDRAIMFVDMSDSTAMKEKKTEAEWLTTLGWFYQQVAETIVTGNGTVVKYLGDGLMAVFDSDHAANAVNVAISIQETIASGQNSHLVDCNCSIGMAFGSAVRFQTGDDEGEHDYVGQVVDKAARLCAAASPKAVLVDRAMTIVANMQKVKSKLGEAETPPRDVDDYVGELEQLMMKGFAKPVLFYEIRWDSTRYGLKAKTMTELAQESSLGEAKKSYPEVEVGEVQRWLTDKKHGWIVADSVFHYVDPRFVVGGGELEVGMKVYFTPRPPIGEGEGKKAVAGCAVAVGQEVTGKVVTSHPDRGFCFIQIADRMGNSYNVHCASDGDTTPSVGELLTFVLAEGTKGASAKDPVPV